MDDLVLPRGVEKHGNSLRISFMYEGERCKEKIEGITNINKNSIRYASNKREAIIVEIKENRFNYRDHFPNSPRALKFCGSSAADINRTVPEGVDMWLEIKTETRAKSTIEGYESKAAHVKEYFEGVKLRTLKTADIFRFRSYLIKVCGLKVKTVNDIFTPLRGAIALAYQDHILKSDIMERIPNLERDETEESEADPYTQKELTKINDLRAAGYSRPQVINMFLFACWTGLSLSEVIALAWEDTDLNTYSVTVQRAYVSDSFKVPKEKSRTRSFELLPPAMEILRDQMRYTYVQKPIEIEVANRSNTHTTSKQIRPVFRNDKAYSDDQMFNKKSVGTAYRYLLQAAKVRHRGPNQCRHTFASMLITKFVPLGLVAELLGHTSEKMLRKHYAAIIPEDRPNAAKLISPFLGIDYEKECLKVLEK